LEWTDGTESRTSFRRIAWAGLRAARSASLLSGGDPPKLWFRELFVVAFVVIFVVSCLTRLLTQIERVLSVNDAQAVSLEIVEAARDSLVIGQA
jgi:hypothetical protein